MKDLQVFNFDSHNVRTVTDENNMSWFCLKDVCDSLDIKNSKSSNFDFSPKGVENFDPLTEGGIQNQTYISEENLYRMIFKSTKQKAKEFQTWVFEQVLPSIRKTGGYHIAQSIDWDELSVQINQAKSAMALLGDSSNELLFVLLKESTGVDILALKPNNIESGVKVSHKLIDIRRYYNSEIAYKLKIPVEVVITALLDLDLISVSNTHYSLTDLGKTLGTTTSQGGFIWLTEVIGLIRSTLK